MRQTNLPKADRGTIKLFSLSHLRSLRLRTPTFQKYFIKRIYSKYLRYLLYMVVLGTYQKKIFVKGHAMAVLVI